MESSEYLVVFMLLAFILYGLGNMIGLPILARRFYRDFGFVDQGKSMLDTPTDSDLLEQLATSHLYCGDYKDRVIEQCKAYPENRRKFTLSKARRKHHQTRWSVTRLKCQQVPAFCLLPLSDAATAFLLMQDPGVDLSEDDDVANRYHLRTRNPEEVKKLVFGNLKEFLLARELISIECVDDTILIKRAWPVEKVRERLLDELECAVDIARYFSTSESLETASNTSEGPGNEKTTFQA